MKSVKDCCREERLERALLVIEGIASSEGEISGELASDIYAIAHGATGRCCEGGDGSPFIDRIDKHQAELKKHKIMDVDRAIKRPIGPHGKKRPYSYDGRT